MTDQPPPSKLWPRISVVLPVHDPALADLERAVESVDRQVWPNIELCVVDDGSRRPEIRSFLDELAARDGVRSVRHDEARGIAAATNAGIELATGGYLLLLDHDDELADDAVDVLVRALRASPDTDLVYSDHDVVDVDGRRIGVDLKPGWSPELLLSYMYVGHLKLVRTSIARDLGGYREGFEGAADFDFALRLAERQPKVVHVPRILYHWRAAERSIARSARLKGYAFESGRRAIQAALDRRGIEARAEWPGWAKRAGIGVFRTRWQGLDALPVAVVLRTRGSPASQESCIESLRRNDEGRVRTIVHADATLSRERLCDLVRSLEEDFLVFLDDTLLVSTPGWIDELLGFALLEGVGAVGAKIVGEDGRIRHAGTVLGIDGGAASAFEGREDTHRSLEHGYYAHTPRNCSGVSRSAMMIRRDRFLDLGGFDERLEPEGQSDTDLCLRLQEKGYRVVSNPYAEAILPADAEPSAIRPLASAPRLRDRWGDRLGRDPYYHPAFSRVRADFSRRTRLVETGSDGRPLAVAAGTRSELDLPDLVDAQAQRIDELETRLAAFTSSARALDRLVSNRAVRWLRSSKLGTRLRERLRGTRLERRLKVFLGRASG